VVNLYLFMALGGPTSGAPPCSGNFSLALGN
jgi:hypothetical protein